MKLSMNNRRSLKRIIFFYLSWHLLREIRDGMQFIFNMMESPPSSSDGKRPDNLFELLIDKCGLEKSCDEALLIGFKKYQTKTLSTFLIINNYM